MTARYVTDNEKAGQMRRSKDWRAKMKADGVSSRSFFVDERQHFVLDAAVQLMRGRPQNLSWWSTLSEANQDHISNLTLRALRQNIAAAGMIMSLADKILIRARNLDIDIDDIPEAITRGVFALGVVNHRLVYSDSTTAARCITGKVKRGHHLPGISALSNDVAQKYDYLPAGDYVRFLPAWTLLVEPFLVDGKRIALIDGILDSPNSETNRAFSEIFETEDWPALRQIIVDHATRPLLREFSETGERTRVWRTIYDHRALFTPLPDTTFTELEQYLPNPRLPIERLVMWGDDQESVMTLVCRTGVPLLVGWSPGWEGDLPLIPASVEDGNVLAVDVVLPAVNVANECIAAGVGQIDRLNEVAERMRIELSRNSIPFEFDAYALGISELSSHYWRDWPVEPIYLSARVHLCFRSATPIDSAAVGILQKYLETARVLGGRTFTPQIVLTDADEVARAWKDVWFVEDRQSEIDAEPNRLKAALEKIADDQSYFLTTIGAQCIEAPHKRGGIRSDLRHSYAVPIAGLARWEQRLAWWAPRWEQKLYAAWATGV